MVDKNIRFREALPPGRRELSLRELPGSVFEYDNIVFCLGLDSEEEVVPYLCHWTRLPSGYHYRVHSCGSLDLKVHRAARVWTQGGYGEMSLAEFLNETVPQ